MKSPVIAGVLVLIILGCVIFLFSYYAGQPEPGEPIPHPMPAACEACGKNYAAKIGKQPAKCRNKDCGEIALWRAFKCTSPDCGAIFPFKGAGQSIVEQPKVECPKCGGPYYTTEINPDELGQP